jgi:putative glutamine amidotransferase
MTHKLPPTIGIICMELKIPDAPERSAQKQSYIDAIVRAGGAPLLIPLLSQTDLLSAIYARCDGLLLPGGGDVAPALFHEERLAHLVSVSDTRDFMELTLARWAVGEDSPKPVLAICRGIQLLNVALGGTLYQDLSLLRQPTDGHNQTGEPRTQRAHRVDIVSPSRLSEILGQEPIQVNSFHHQAIKERASRLTLTARAPDGVVEAVEVQGHPFAIGVQWHPEDLAAEDAGQQRLFDAFVAACRR